ncbi:MAG TPA: DUF433 domain-containing protein [Longimicrobiaceae bacterium]|nr:DUF433 domain-containing protein [Longimicrobiaceae bacterium]
MSARDEALRLIGALPESSTWEDVVRALAARAYGPGTTGAAARVRELRAEYGPPEVGGGAYHTEAGSNAEMPLSERITMEPGKRGGKPCVRGLRITVYDVLGYLASGMSEDEILADFPDLERADVRACLAFAADQGRRVWQVPA